MKQKPRMERFGEFMEGKGFYIVLFLCVAAIGISGYFLFTGLVSSIVGSQQTKNVSGTAQVQVVEPTAPEIPTQSTQTAQEPKTQDVVKPVTQSSSSTAADTSKPVYVWPVRGDIIRDFSLEAFAYDETMGDWRTHSGVDIAAKVGTKVLAVADGTVSSVKKDSLMGMTVTIDHDKGLQSVYSNLDNTVSVKKGQVLTYSTVIGTVGNTAIAESSGASHLHFEMHQDGTPVDPMQYLKN